MSFDKNYPNRKDWRKGYRRSARFDGTCRPGGGCSYCEGNRTYGDRRRLFEATRKLNEED